MGVMCVHVNGHTTESASHRQARPPIERIKVNISTPIKVSGLSTPWQACSVSALLTLYTLLFGGLPKLFPFQFFDIFSFLFTPTSKTQIGRNTHQNPADFADASDDEHVKVHHIINIRPSHSIYDRDNERNPKFRSRVFTQQSSFKHEENLPPETYPIVHTRLVPGEDEHIHDIAVLTYDEGAARTETETHWILKLCAWIIFQKLRALSFDRPSDISDSETKNHLILSMGPCNLETLRGNVLTLEKMAQPESGPAMLQIRFIDLEGKEYCLPKLRCQTWFELITMFVGTLEEENFMLTSFLNDSWRDEYELRVDNELVSEENWPEILREREGNNVTIHILTKPLKVVRHNHSRPSVSAYDAYSSYDGPNRHRRHGYSTRATFMNQRTKDDDDSIRQYRTDAIQENAWKSGKKPIRLKDLAGFELMIPWRVGRTWRKMESVIGTKMQYDPEHLNAFRAGAYALNGPDGLLTPADWDDKICPGCVVELRLTGSNGNLELIGPRHPSRGPRSPSRAESSSGATDQTFTPTPLRRVDTDHQIELPGFAATRASAENDDCETSECHGETTIVQCPETNMRELVPTPEFDTSPKPSDHDTEPNSAEENEQHLGITQKPVRRATDLQSFVEDADEESSSEKGSLTSMTATISPAEGIDLDLRESTDRQSRTSSFGPDQPSLELRDYPILLRHTSSLKIENDSIHMASLEQKEDSVEKSTVAQSSSGTETTPLCPIFAWKLEATDGLPSTPSEKSEPIPDQYRDMDRTIRAILEERDAEANIYFLQHERENDLISSLFECSRIDVLLRMKMTGHAQNRSSDAQFLVKKKSEWKRVQDIISDAMEILDAFVPVHYQNLHQFWLIKKFYGALLAFVTKEYPRAFLDFIGQDMSYFCKNIRQIHAGITRGGDEESTTFYLPKALVEAFNPLITYVCICSQIDHDASSDLDLLKRCAKKVHKSLRIGKYQLISMIRAGDFSEAKVFRRVSAQNIITMVTGRLARIPSEKPNGLPDQDGFNLLQIYRRYISRLELQVRMDPNAETFDAIQRLREELNIVNIVLDQQLGVLEKMKLVWINLNQSSQQISLQSIHQSRKMIKQMKRDLDELEDMAGKTSMLLRSMIEVRKESNSSAITIFTIVTVVFLPLSFITSYLGMNSVDIRNGTFHQSLFWAIALPSAACLIFILWIRRVKCDETPGACNTCSQAGWKCEGYDEARLASRGDAKTTSLTIQLIGRVIPGKTPEERRRFAFFQQVTVPGLGGYFGSQLWTDLVLPMSHSEQAVNHAIVALGTLHEDLEARGAPLSRENLNNRYQRFAIQQFGRSLTILNQRQHSRDPRLRDVILTCCLLFVAFDLLRGHYEPALAHLRQGLAIIEESRLASASSLGDSNSKYMDAVERSLLATMSRLETQSFFFGLGPVAIQKGQIENDYFYTLSDARQALDQELAEIVLLCKDASQIPAEARLPNRHPELAMRQIKIKRQIEDFSKRLSQSELYFLRPKSIKEHRGLDLIHLHCILFNILLETVLVGEDQSIYKEYLDQFEHILVLSEKISDSFLEESTSHSRPTLLFDMGVLPSLFLICWRCHDLSLRRRALEALEAWPHREGLFDSRLLVIFAQQLIQLDVELSLSSDRTPISIIDPALEISQDQTYAILKYHSRELGQELSQRTRVVVIDENC
ncbi:Mg2+ transporter protein CorA-like/Zinc transport protein ZntB [Penicillium atrosanguineum]|nr:Mg2+ transporter protein CorA-like/Zinc transport protein ZntB [Penicillium atrosanguineum]